MILIITLGPWINDGNDCHSREWSGPGLKNDMAANVDPYDEGWAWSVWPPWSSARLAHGLCETEAGAKAQADAALDRHLR